MSVGFHLVGVELLKHVVLFNQIIDESYGNRSGYFDRILTVLMTVEPCLGPPSDSGTVRIDAYCASYVETLDVNLQTGQRVDNPVLDYQLPACFFFSSAVRLLRYIPCLRAR